MGLSKKHNRWAGENSKPAKGSRSVRSYVDKGQEYPCMDKQKEARGPRVKE